MAGLKRYRGQYDAGKVGKEVHSGPGRICRWEAQEDFCPAGSFGTAQAGPQLPADRQADADWGGDCEALAGRLDLHGGAMTSPEDSTRTRGTVLRYI